MYAVIRIRGKTGTRDKINDTLKMLNLNKKYSCTLIPERKDYEGMLRKVENFVTWGKATKETAEKILEKRSGIENKDDIIKGLGEGKTLGDMKVQRSFPLSPPSKGFKKTTKKIYPKGSLGHRGKEINKLLERMV